MRFLKIFLLSLLCALPFSAQAQDTYGEYHDPIEGFNRGVYAFNRGVDKILLRPVAWGYRYAVPQYGRDRVGDFFTNLSEPVTFLNSLLQGDVNNAFVTFWRFAINSSVGILGLYDQAQYAGLKLRREDFGQTLGWYGVGPGFYLMLPILGPSSGRDAIGRLADTFTTPTTYIEEEWVPIGLTIAEGIHRRSTVLDFTDQVDATAIDPYATYRSTYMQYRADMIRNGRPSVK